MTKKLKNFTMIYATITIAGVLIFAGLTKFGYIPNFLNIGMLNSWDNETSFEHFGPGEKKPVIYLYPKTKQDIKVQLDYKGKFTASYPEFDYGINGWEVVANPDGSLINKKDNREYSYLFWEGISKDKIKWDLSSGFVVRGSETREFLQNVLPKFGLNPKEYNEFVVYWYPLMKDNPYNLIHFAGKEYTDSVPLTIIPKPDSILRVFMVYKPLDVEIGIPEQKIVPFQREGFSVIEWGGTKIE